MKRVFAGLSNELNMIIICGHNIRAQKVLIGNKMNPKGILK